MRTKTVQISVPQISTKSASIGLVGFMTLGLFCISLYNLMQIYTYSGCINCECDQTDNSKKKKKIRDIFNLGLAGVLMGLFLLIICFVLANSPNLHSYLTYISLFYGIITFVLMLLDAVILGMVQQDKDLASIREKDPKSYKNWSIAVGVGIGIKAFLFIGYMVLWKMYGKSASSSGTDGQPSSS